MISFKGYCELLEKELKKGSWALLLTSDDKKEHSSDLIDVVGTAYKHTTLGSFVKSLDDVTGSEWMVLDYDKDPDVDIAIFYRKPRASEPWTGFKIQGIGHDGTKESKEKLMKKVVGLVNGKNFWIEASDAMAAALIKLGANKETNEDTLKALFPTIKEIKDDGSYIRVIAGKVAHEMVFGKIKLK